MLRDFLTLGAVNTVTGAQPNNPGLLGPLNQPIGPLPAMQMPGEIAKTVPVMANFQWILQVLQTATFATIEDDSAILLGSRRLVAGDNITFEDSYDETGPGNHATLTISSTGGGGGGKEIYFDVDPPPAGTETDWIAWWNTEEGSLKIWYTDIDGSQWVDASVARTGAPGASGSVSPLTTKGDIWGYATADARIPVGTDGDVLTADSGASLGVSWQAVPGSSPLTTKGDLFGFDTGDARVPIGTNGQVLTADSGQALGLAWTTLTAYAPVGALYITLATDATLTNERVLTQGVGITLTDNGAGGTLVIDATASGISPLTTKGDVWGFSTVDARVPVGADGEVLTADSGDPLGVSWQAAGSVSPLTTKGDLYGFSTLDARVPIGSNDQVLIADSAQALGLKWGAASPLTTKGDIYGFSTVNDRLAVGSNGKVLTADSTAGLGLSWQTPATGTVTSVALTMPAGFSVGGSPVTSSGTLAVTGGPNASFLTLGTSADLANERVATAGAGISITDNGAGSTAVIACTISAGGTSQSQEFTNSGTFNVPANVSLVKVTMIGGGGGGSSRNVAAGGGGSGGSGELVVDFPIVVTPSGAVTVTIGAAGAKAVGAGAGVAGGTGGTTSFGAFSVLGGLGGTSGGAGGTGGGSNGGAGGGAAAVGALGVAESACHFGGSGGSGGGNTTATNGGAGRAGPGFSTGTAGGLAASSQAGGASGAGTIWGQGGQGGAGGAIGAAPASTAYGAGGGGAGGKATTGVDGGDGAKGYVLVTYIS